jgi:hypothetical protein
MKRHTNTFSPAVWIEMRRAQHRRVRWRFHRFLNGPQSGSHNTHGSASPLCHPGRSDFPSPVGDHDFQSAAFPRRLAGLSVHPHAPPKHRFAATLDTPVLFTHLIRLSVLNRCPNVPAMAESPFAPSRRYLVGRRVYRHVDQRYPALLATTDSCADPSSSATLPFSSGGSLRRLL